MLKRQAFEPLGAFSYNKNEKSNFCLWKSLILALWPIVGGGLPTGPIIDWIMFFLVVGQICVARQLKKKRKNHFAYYFTYNSLQVLLNFISFYCVQEQTNKISCGFGFSVGSDIQKWCQLKLHLLSEVKLSSSKLLKLTSGEDKGFLYVSSFIYINLLFLLFLILAVVLIYLLLGFCFKKNFQYEKNPWVFILYCFYF